MNIPELIKDDFGQAIQGALTPDIAQTVSLSDTTARNSSNFESRVVRLYSTVNCFIRFGQSTVEATLADHFLPAGAIEYFTRKENHRVAGILASGTGTLYISEMY